MIRIFIFFTFLTTFSACFSSCGGGSSDEIIPPTSLDFTIVVSEENPAEVTITATADNASFYRFYATGLGSFVQKSDGVFIHTFTTSGEKTITVQAHATPDEFISLTKTVDIEIPDFTETMPTGGYVSPESYDGYAMVWQDEFAGDEISDDWTFEIGNGSNGWGNNELEYYREQNTRVKNGYLVIEAKKESFGGQNYTSSRIITKGNQFFTYGRVDIRALLPYGQGIWPALWMLGENIDEVGWPACGEIDIMEMIGGQGREKTVHGTVHWQSNSGYANYGGDTTLASGNFSEKFHVFSIEWDAEFIRWYLDGEEYHVIDITPDHLSEFHDNFFFIMNVAVGGNWPGSPEASTVFPQYMAVDYIRVFQKE